MTEKEKNTRMGEVGLVILLLGVTLTFIGVGMTMGDFYKGLVVGMGAILSPLGMLLVLAALRDK